MTALRADWSIEKRIWLICPPFSHADVDDDEMFDQILKQKDVEKALT
jgi:hypothetical protein